MADKNKDSTYNFSSEKESRKSIEYLKKAKGDRAYKIRVALGIINRAKSTLEKTPNVGTKKDIEQSIRVWQNYINILKGSGEEEEPEQDQGGVEINKTLDDAGALDMNLGDKNIITTKDKGRGLVIKLTEQGAYSIYYWQDDPAVRYPSEIYLDGKKVYMPIRLVHMGFEPDGVKSEDDIGRMQMEGENKDRLKNKDDKDIKGHQPSKYYDGLKKDTKKARLQQFKQQAKKSSGQPSAYKKAPGGSKTTKPSDYTKKYKNKFKDKVKKKLKEESSKGLKNKAKESGAPLSILKKVYDRGLAAWRTGHRPGASQHAWAMARVNSFLTSGKTTRTADKDLYNKWKDKSKTEQISEMFTFVRDHKNIQ